MALCHDIRHTQHFEDCAHRTASNDAGTLRSGSHHHNSGAMVASWVSQASFDPPGISIAVAKDRAIESLLQVGDRFVLNILREDNHQPLLRHFLKRFPPGADRFAGVNVLDGVANGGPVLGQVVQIEAVVTQTLPGLKGYTVQAVAAEQDSDTATSEGVFVYLNNSALAVDVGQRVRLQGTVGEYFTQTQLADITATLDCGSSALPEPVEMSLPVASLAELEAVEGVNKELAKRIYDFFHDNKR